MSKLMIAFIAASFAGITGFTIGAFSYRTDYIRNKKLINDAELERQEAEEALMVAEKQMKDQRSQLIEFQKDDASAETLNTSVPSNIFEMNKEQLIVYCKSKGFQIGPEPYMNQSALTVFPLEGDAQIRVVWQGIEYNRIDSILISNTMIDHSPTGASPVLSAWKLIENDMVLLFNEYATEYEDIIKYGTSPRRWYNDGPYAYDISANNKYIVDYIGPKSAINNLKKQHLECAILYLGWFNEIEKSQKKAKNIIEANPTPDELFEKISKELDLLAFNFGSVRIYDMGDDFPIDNPEYFYNYIPPTFNEEAQSTLLKAAGAVYRLAFIAEQKSRHKREIGFNVYDELIGAVFRAGHALDYIWGDYSRLEGFDKSSHLPEKYHKKMEEIGLLAFAAQINR